MSGKSSYYRHQYCYSGCGGKEVVHGQADHLREIGHRRLAAVILPVCVGIKAY